MENVYIYDDTFISLLSLVEELIKKNIRPLKIACSSYTPNLFEQIVNLSLREIDIDKLADLIGNFNFKVVYFIYLSNNENKELIIYYYILNAYKYKEKLVYYKNLKCVTRALKIFHNVSNEMHRFKGFTRFKRLLNNVYYAQINPDNNILYLLSDHFSKRLKCEYWMIEDVNRKILSIYDRHNYYIISSSSLKFDLLFAQEEKKIVDLWQNFYDTIAIESRTNERCRRNFMPKKYWKYITEVGEKFEKSNKEK